MSLNIHIYPTHLYYKTNTHVNASTIQQTLSLSRTNKDIQNFSLGYYKMRYLPYDSGAKEL